MNKRGWNILGGILCTTCVIHGILNVELKGKLLSLWILCVIFATLNWLCVAFTDYDKPKS